eukprot:TRINITY_DN3698_c0_g1_i1.p1 TRINITY_DN3698_c0_g1~~TRINITY_DN3698_c0_g1_i1.p1  ORF type:complete len:328 (-),score=45.24 TRINITY_DN3698_c0_g1_i1:342-1325(-)
MDLEEKRDELENSQLLGENVILPKSEKICYGVTDFGNKLLDTTVGFYLNAFLLEVAGVSALWAGNILLISKMFDAVNDPIFGILSDKTKSKFGKRKIWMITSVVPFLLVFFYMWYVPETSPALKFLYYQVMTILYSAFTTAFQLPYFALAPEITKSYDDRTVVVGFRTAFGILGMIIGPFLHGVVIDMFKNANTGLPDKKMGYMVSVGILSILSLFPFIITILFVKEKPSHLSPNPKFPFLQGIKAMIKNKAFISVMFVYFFSQVALQFVQNNLLLYIKYVLNLEDWFPYLLLCFLSLSALSLPLWSYLDGRKRGCMWWEGFCWCWP